MRSAHTARDVIPGEPGLALNPSVSRVTRNPSTLECVNATRGALWGSTRAARPIPTLTQRLPCTLTDLTFTATQLVGCVLVSISTVILMVAAFRPGAHGCCNTPYLAITGGLIMVMYAFCQIYALALVIAIDQVDGDTGEHCNCQRVILRAPAEWGPGMTLLEYIGVGRLEANM